MTKNCRDYISNLSDYLDGDLDAALCEEIEKHIGACTNCRIMVDSLRQTVTLCREGRPEALPKELEERLTSALKKRWQEKFRH